MNFLIDYTNKLEDFFQSPLSQSKDLSLLNWNITVFHLVLVRSLSWALLWRSRCRGNLKSNSSISEIGRRICCRHRGYSVPQDRLRVGGGAIPELNWAIPKKSGVYLPQSSQRQNVGQCRLWLCHCSRSHRLGACRIKVVSLGVATRSI